MADIYKIPDSLIVFFQEFDPARLDLAHDAETIIERTLRFGNRAELRWLFACYGQPHIATWVREMGEYRLPERCLSFWRLLLDIEAPTGRSERKAIWPY